jgi:hypothetical protein
MHQHLWGYKVEEKLNLGVREQKQFEYRCFRPLLFICMHSTYPVHLIRLDIIICVEAYKALSSSLCNFLYPPRKIFFDESDERTPSLKRRKQVSHTYVISDFRRRVNEIYALLGCYAAQIVRPLLTFRDNLSVPSFRYS